jgi:protocatechuate 3,4-dioxygenase beta subunit
VKDNSASITGQITLDGKPTAGLEVALLPQHHFSRDNAVAIGETDNTGRYFFDCLPMGRYWLKVGSPGYFNPLDWDDEGPGRNVSVADVEFVENADLHLVLGGVISGRVTDPDGRPVVGQFVELTMLDKWGPPDEPFDLPGEEGDFFTNGNGEYRIYGIPPGRYFVSIGVDVSKVTGAKDKYPHDYRATGHVYGDHYFEQRFYPGTSNRANADMVDISIGTIVDDVNISAGRPIRAYTVTGCVIHDETRTPIRHCYLELGYYSHRGCRSSYIMDGPTDTDENGNFRVEGLLPGRFFLTAQFEGETELHCTPVEFEIKNEDIAGLEIKAHWGVELRGRVVIEGAENHEAAERLEQLKLQAYMQASIGNHIRGCTVKSDGRFVICGLRPGPVHWSLEFEETSKYFSIVRIEYPDDSGETVSILPTPMSFSPKLPSFSPPAPPNALPPMPPAPPNTLPPRQVAPPNISPPPPPGPLNTSPLLPPTPLNTVPPLPTPTPALSPELHSLPPAQLNKFLPTITVADSDSPRPWPAPNHTPQSARVAAPSELLGPRFPGDLPPLQLTEHGLSDVRLVLSYQNGSIRGHVTFKREDLDSDPQLKAHISHRSESSWPRSANIDPNGDFFVDGLAPGEYEVSILSSAYDLEVVKGVHRLRRTRNEGTKTIVVDKDSESRISFVIDGNARE